jgi:hypothetical protein
MRHAQQSAEQKVMWLPNLAESQFRPQIVAALRSIIQQLENTESTRHLPQTVYDLPTQERYRRAS